MGVAVAPLELPAALPCVALLGGTFDPIHNGHVALGRHFQSLLQAEELRVIPTGIPWQKSGLHASREQRLDMVRLAFEAENVAIVLDRQELDRSGVTYTIDTLRAIRAEVGPQVSLVFLIGADQLQHLDSWHDWRRMFDYAHLGVAARPGFSLAEYDIPAAVRQEFVTRQAEVALLRATPHGHMYLAKDLAVDISATAIRLALQRGERPSSLMAPIVLDYIEQHNLYKN
jgi:nicotinate-nucleotide adenylyltransferase